MKTYTDTELLDWLQSQTKGYGKGWICRLSTTGRGIRLHETSGAPGLESDEVISKDIREAIIIAMENKGTII
jgi:hypothetical protein